MPGPSLIFTLSIQGSGNLRLRFRQALLARHPKVTVYDRNQDTEWKHNASFLPPAHPEVADIDVFFKVSGPCDEITLRCRGQHRFFSFNPDHPQNGEVRLERLLGSIVDTTESLLLGTGGKAVGGAAERGTATETLDPVPEKD
ncbi:MAG: hypothetical protein V2I48_06070 [Xanthomonadales bacterium]|jgi:hypothetical protein|nr:hypothetical protein [Xanthomonadales bacterium]